MAFGIGINSQGANAGIIRGFQKEVACECWFTAGGKITPVLLKLEDEDGEIHTIRQIEARSQEKKNYAGTPSIEFDCMIEIQQRLRKAYLIYYLSENRWALNFR